MCMESGACKIHSTMFFQIPDDHISVLFFGESFGAGKFGSLNTEKPTHSQIQAPVCSSRIHRLPSTLSRVGDTSWASTFIYYIYDTLLKHQWVHHSSASHVFWMMIEKKQIPTEALTISMRLFEEVLVMQVGVQMQEEQHICFHWGSLSPIECCEQLIIWSAVCFCRRSGYQPPPAPAPRHHMED